MRERDREKDCNPVWVRVCLFRDTKGLLCDYFVRRNKSTGKVFGFWFVIPPRMYPFKYIRIAYEWCAVIGQPGSARPEGTQSLPQWTLNLESNAYKYKKFFLFLVVFMCRIASPPFTS